MLLIPVFAFAQDMIILKNNARFNDCKILSEDSLNVYFQFNENAEVISSFISKDSIQSYKYGETGESVIQASAPVKNNTAVFYQTKIDRYTKLKRTGTTLGIAGGAMALFGVVLVANTDWQVKEVDNGYGGTTTNINASDASGLVGVVLLVAGTAMGITGIVLGTSGARNAEKYERKLKTLSLNMISKPQNTGLLLTYRF
jgi:hypothetical protein